MEVLLDESPLGEFDASVNQVSSRLSACASVPVQNLRPLCNGSARVQACIRVRACTFSVAAAWGADVISLFQLHPTIPQIHLPSPFLGFLSCPAPLPSMHSSSRPPCLDIPLSPSLSRPAPT